MNKQLAKIFTLFLLNGVVYSYETEDYHLIENTAVKQVSNPKVIRDDYIELFKRKALNGDGGAASMLSLHYLSNFDLELSRYWEKISANNGSHGGMWEYSLSLLNSQNELDRKESIKWMKKVVAAGKTNSKQTERIKLNSHPDFSNIYEYAEDRLNELMNDPSRWKDNIPNQFGMTDEELRKKAIKGKITRSTLSIPDNDITKFEAKALKGDGLAANKLSRHYSVKMDNEKANYWLKISAENEFPAAMLNYALFLLRSPNELDRKQSIEWLERTSDNESSIIGMKAKRKLDSLLNEPLKWKDDIPNQFGLTKFGLKARQEYMKKIQDVKVQ